jgi:Gas vesicle protein
LTVTDATTGWNSSRTPLRRDPGGFAPPAPASLVDVLERVLDKGIVIVGDIRVNLVDIELLTIKVRLLIASVDRAREMGINWWEHDPTLSVHDGDLAEENRQLRARVAELESRSPDAVREEPGSESGGNG